MRRILAAMLAATLLLGPMPMTAWAQDVTQQVEQLSGEAAAAYREGDYAEAVRLFEEAYALQAVPNLLFNIAKVYEKMEDWDNAAAKYRQFIKAPDADSSAREIALERIDALEEIRRVEREEEEKRLAEQRRLEEEERQRREEEERAAVEPDDEGSSNTAAWITLGSGATLLAGGVVFGLLASSEQSKFVAGESADDRRAARSSGKTYALVADSMFAAGAIATAVGIILFAVSGSGDTEPDATAATPTGWVGPDGDAGVAIGWRF